MLQTEIAKVCRIIDGKLSCKAGRTDIFAEKSVKVETLERKVRAAESEFEEAQIKHILTTFRIAVNDFFLATGAHPTLCLMNYRDVRLLCEAYNRDAVELNVERPTLSHYSDDAKRIVDGVKIKQGCDQKPGEIRFYGAVLDVPKE